MFILLTEPFVRGQSISLNQQLKNFVSGIYLSKTNPGPIKEIKTFYKALDYQTAWIYTSNQSQLSILIDQVISSNKLGLNPEDYCQTYLENFNNGILSLGNTNDSIEAEIRITDIAIHFYSDLFNDNSTSFFCS